MVISGYGIQLVQLSREDLELVRVKRNAGPIRARMQYREEITPEMQVKWFEQINNESNNFYVIVTNGEKVGLINGSEVDWEKRVTGNGGIFIWEEKYWDSVVPTAASILLTDLTFLVGLERVHIKVLRDNPKAIGYNTRLGFRLIEGQADEQNQVYELTEHDYELHVGGLKKSLHKQYGQDIAVKVDNPEHPFCKRIIAIHGKLSPEKKAHFHLEIL